MRAQPAHPRRARLARVNAGCNHNPELSGGRRHVCDRQHVTPALTAANEQTTVGVPVITLLSTGRMPHPRACAPCVRAAARAHAPQPFASRYVACMRGSAAALGAKRPYAMPSTVEHSRSLWHTKSASYTRARAHHPSTSAQLCVYVYLRRRAVPGTVVRLAAAGCHVRAQLLHVCVRACVRAHVPPSQSLPETSAARAAELWATHGFTQRCSAPPRRRAGTGSSRRAGASTQP